MGKINKFKFVIIFLLLTPINAFAFNAGLFMGGKSYRRSTTSTTTTTLPAVFWYTPYGERCYYEGCSGNQRESMPKKFKRLSGEVMVKRALQKAGK